jgi:hypothetical protein
LAKEELGQTRDVSVKGQNRRKLPSGRRGERMVKRVKIRERMSRNGRLG